MGIALSRTGGQAGIFRTLDSQGLGYMTHLVRRPNDRCEPPREEVGSRGVSGSTLPSHPLPAAIPWPGIWLGQLISATWYWCLDQEMAQRVLAARNLRHAQLGTAAAAALKTLPVYMVAFPGMAARALFESCRASGGQVRAPTQGPARQPALTALESCLPARRRTPGGAPRG